ncbi:MAG: carbamoyl transferase NodU family protein [Cyanobacteria bacterium]|nr:carbamoyl transferase NodU family protein [Cyanobacteriota bacterium]
MKTTLSVSAFHGIHDSCVTFANDQHILLHLEAERISRRKHDSLNAADMENLILTGLRYLDLEPDCIDEFLVAKLGDPLEGKSRAIGGYELAVTQTGHHLNHIGTILSELSLPALIVCADGGSEDGTTRLYSMDSVGHLSILEDLDQTPLNGRFYGTLTQLLIDPDFLKAHAHYPGKTMGLAAYGNDDIYLREWLARSWQYLNTYYGDGNDLYPLRSALGLSTDYESPWLYPQTCDVARNAQQLWIEWFLHKLSGYAHSFRTIALTGGCALNVVLNTAISESGMFDKVVVGPASSDSGQSLGALLWRNPKLTLKLPFLGRGGPDLDECPTHLVDDLLSGKVVAWFEGRSEIGPRALGHRSILCLPFPVSQKDRINHLKGREPYRPIAPMIRECDLKRFFYTNTPSPYMTFAPLANRETQLRAPAIVHYDGTSRLQTIRPETHKALHSALDSLNEAIGIPILCNTSFNFAGEPIVDTADDALRNFSNSNLDIMYIDGERFSR